MDIVLWIVAAVGLLAELTAAVIGRFYRIAFLRNKEEHADINTLGKPWGAYLEQITEGIEWLQKNATETAHIESFDGLRLFAWVVEQENARGTVLMCHGYRSRGFLDFSCAFRFFYEQGLNLVVIEQRACGNSEGNIITFGIKESRDVSSWANWVRERFGAEMPIILAGVSMGCTSVIMSVEYGLPDNVAGIVADCGYTSAWRQLAHVLKRDYRLPPFPILHLVNYLFKRRTGCDLRSFDTLSVLSGCDIPVLFVHGGADRFVPTDMSVEGWRACSADKDILIVEGAAHATSSIADPKQYQSKVKAFLDGILH